MTSKISSLVKLTSAVILLMLSASCGGRTPEGGATGSSDTHGTEEHDEHDDHDDHADDSHGGMELPEIEAVSLDGRRLRIVATTSIIGDVMKQVAGDAAEVTVMMKAGGNPHSYTPGPRDVAALEDSDLVFVNGLGLEEELLAILESISGPVVVPVSAGIEPMQAVSSGGDEDYQETEDDHDHESGDPHFWFSPLNVIHWVENIELVLFAADPGNHDAYEASAEAYITALEALDGAVRAMVDRIPAADRKLVTDHASIGYFARDYGFVVAGNLIPALSDQAEPSARQVAALTNLVQSEDLRAIFVGETAGRGVLSLAESVSAESGRDIPVVSILTGSLAPEGERGDSYPDFIRYNTERIVGALTR